MPLIPGQDEGSALDRVKAKRLSASPEPTGGIDAAVERISKQRVADIQYAIGEGQKIDQGVAERAIESAVAGKVTSMTGSGSVRLRSPGLRFVMRIVPCIFLSQLRIRIRPVHRGRTSTYGCPYLRGQSLCGSELPTSRVSRLP